MDEMHIHESRAMSILRQEGDFTENQARIVLLHSRKESYNGATYYPMGYIYKRAKDNAEKGQ